MVCIDLAMVWLCVWTLAYAK